MKDNLMSEANDRTDLILRADMWLVFLGSLLIAGYLVCALVLDPAARCGEQPPPAEEMPAAGKKMPWVEQGEPVPPEALYSELAPAPRQKVKERSWHNRIFFTGEACPYCGRRLPTKHTSYFFLLIGFIGQIAFSARFLVQWIATERARESVVPTAFWWLSIFGSLLLLIYALSIKAIPIILGQAPNCFIYARNLYFIRRRRRILAQAGDEADEDDANG